MKTLGFGIIGCGMIAEIHTKGINELANCKVVACYDPVPGKARAFAEKYGCRGYEDIKAFLADSDLDAVTIATPSGLHLDGALAAINAGKHVMVEKPLEITIERCDKIIKAAAEKGVLLGGIFHSRYFEVPQLIKRTIESGRLGTIAMADAQVKWYRSQKYYDSGAWRGTWKLDGGGALMNQSIHAIDLLQWFMGPVTEINGRVATLAHERIEVEDTAVATLKFANGALGVIEGTTCAYPGFLKRIEICGSKGTILMEEESLKVWEFEDAIPEDDEIRAKYIGASTGDGGAGDPSSLGYQGHKMEFAAFADSIRASQIPDIDGHEARKAVEIIEAIYQSAKLGGKTVTLPLVKE